MTPSNPYTGGMLTDGPMPLFVEPDAPDPTPIMAIHRGHDGYVTFHDRDEGGRFRDLYAIQASELSEGLFREQLARDLDRDAFYSVNAYYRPARTRSKVRPDLYRPARSSDNLRWLTACYVDLDCHKLGLSIGQAIGGMIDLQERGIVPNASMFTRSGRGVWAFWFLRDAWTGNGPQRAAWAPTATYYRLQHQLGRLTEHLGHDKQARDAARVTRVPGSVNATAGVRVHYWLQADQDGQPFTYSIEELCARLDVMPVTRTTPTLAKAIDPTKRERGRRGWKALWTKRLEAFLQLVSMRGGGMPEGMRNRACWLYAGMMHKLKVDEGELAAHVEILGDRCKPSLSGDEIQDAINSRKKLRRIENQTIGDWLDVTPAESAELGGRFPPATRFGVSEPAKLEPATQRERREQRRGALVSIIGKGVVPPLRDLQASLSEWGIEATISTIRTDLKAIGKSNPRARKRRDDGPLLIEAAGE